MVEYKYKLFWYKIEKQGVSHIQGRHVWCRIKLKTGSQTFIYKASNVFHWSIPYGSHMDVCWLVVFSLMPSPKILHSCEEVTIDGEGLKNLGLIRSVLQVLWAGRVFYRATPIVTQSLCFCVLTCRTAPFRLLVRGSEDLLWPGSPCGFGMQGH